MLKNVLNDRKIPLETKTEVLKCYVQVILYSMLYGTEYWTISKLRDLKQQKYDKECWIIASKIKRKH